MRWNDPLKTKKGLQYCKPDSIIIDPAHTANAANLMQMMRMQMGQEKVHTLFFYNLKLCNTKNDSGVCLLKEKEFIELLVFYDNHC